VRKGLACRTPVLGCPIYQGKGCGHVELISHSCKSRFCPTGGKHATDVWAERQTEYTGANPLICPHGNLPLTFAGTLFGSGKELHYLFDKAGKDSTIPTALLRPG
jgi:hypothetical protein